MTTGVRFPTNDAGRFSSTQHSDRPNMLGGGLKRESNHPPPSSAEVKNVWSMCGTHPEFLRLQVIIYNSLFITFTVTCMFTANVYYMDRYGQWGHNTAVKYGQFKCGSTVKVNQSHNTLWRPRGERRYSSYSFTNSAPDGGEWPASRPGRALLPGKGPLVPIVQEAGWAPEPVWTQRLEEKILCVCRE
jgi:hypothetical protein